MSTLMLPAATITTMTNTAPIAVAQQKADPSKAVIMNNNNKQGKLSFCLPVACSQDVRYLSVNESHILPESPDKLMLNFW